LRREHRGILCARVAHWTAADGRSASPLDNPMLRPATLVATLLLGAVALAADSPRWVEVSGGAWEPQSALFSQLESALRPIVAAATKNRGPLPDWNSYTFQYQGRRTMLGRKYIYINAFCDDPRHHSPTQWVEVLDGGACFFRAKYDPESNQVYDVVVNGVA
jgi:hypothetical protein